MGAWAFSFIFGVFAPNLSLVGDKSWVADSWGGLAGPGTFSLIFRVFAPNLSLMGVKSWVAVVLSLIFGVFAPILSLLVGNSWGGVHFGSLFPKYSLFGPWSSLLGSLLGFPLTFWGTFLGWGMASGFSGFSLNFRMASLTKDFLLGITVVLGILVSLHPAAGASTLLNIWFGFSTFLTGLWVRWLRTSVFAMESTAVVNFEPGNLRVLGVLTPTRGFWACWVPKTWSGFPAEVTSFLLASMLASTS